MAFDVGLAAVVVLRYGMKIIVGCHDTPRHIVACRGHCCGMSLHFHEFVKYVLPLIIVQRNPVQVGQDLTGTYGAPWNFLAGSHGSWETIGPQGKPWEEPRGDPWESMTTVVGNHWATSESMRRFMVRLKCPHWFT